MAGQRKSAMYPFSKNKDGGKTLSFLWCDFSDDFTNATTIVHNALESFDARLASGYDMAPDRSQEWLDNEYEYVYD